MSYHLIDINIGLNTLNEPTPVAAQFDRAARCLRYLGPRFGGADARIVMYADPAEGENTLVLRVRIHEDLIAPLNYALISLAMIEDQEAIAYFDHTAEAGNLVGPGADKWLPFNPEYFIEY